MGLFSLDEKALSGLTFGLARDPSQRLQALRLRQEVYVRKGLIKRQALNRLYIPPQSFLPRSALLVARRGDTVVGTLSVYADSEMGLPMEEVHAQEVDCMRRQASSLAEVGGLAVAEEERAFGVTLMLYYTMFRWSSANQFSALVACTHPSVRRVYQSAFLFELLGKEQAHPRLCNAPSIPMVLDMLTVRDRARKIYEKMSGKMDLYSFFCEEDFPLDFPEITNGPVLQWSADEILTMASEGYLNLSDVVFEVLASHYGPSLRDRLSNHVLGGASDRHFAPRDDF